LLTAEIDEFGGIVAFLGDRGSEPKDWSGVRDRVVAVQRIRGRTPPLRPVFERVLTFDEINEVEAEIEVSLPEEYAAFLTEVGSGGPGPEIELTTLRKVDGRWAWVWEGDTVLATDASGSFLENHEWLDHQVATLRAADHEPTVRDAVTDHLDDYCEAFGEDAGYRLFHEQRFRGAIHISDNGCGMTSWLVLVGPHRGEIWFRDCAPNPPLEPLLDASGKPHTFYTWYTDWLERNETNLGQGGAGSNPVSSTAE
jgi:hypothetical protein